MIRTLPRRLADEAGMSLVEILVAMVVLTVVFTGLASVLTTSLRAVAANEGDLRAHALATEVIEGMRAIPWSSVGFYDSDFGGAVPVVNGQQTVRLGATRPPGALAPLPNQSLVRGGTTYAVQRQILWHDDPSTSSTQDYKRLVANLSWTAGGRPQTLSLFESHRAPTPAEQAASDFVVRRWAVEPELGGVLDAAGNLVSHPALSITAETSSAASSVWVDFPDRSGVVRSVALASSAGGRQWSANVSGWTFRNGYTTFTFRVTPPTGPVLSVTTIVQLLQPLHAVATVTPATVDCASAPALGLQVHVDGLTEANTARVTWPVGAATNELPLQLVSTDVAGATFATTIPAGTYAAPTTFTISAERGYDGATTSTTTTVGVNPCP